MADLDKILLVRALVQRPNVLLLSGIGDMWSVEDKPKLCTIVRGFLDGSLDDCLMDTDNSGSIDRMEWLTSRAKRQSRTVLW